jgi:fibro-slime domain-containing protein
MAKQCAFVIGCRLGELMLLMVLAAACTTEPMVRGTGPVAGSGPSSERTGGRGGSGGDPGGGGSTGGSGFVLPDAAPAGASPDLAPSEPIPRCGNQVINDGEACDDGNTAGGDGCTPMCQVEPGWACAAGGVCKAARCGDGQKVGSEECDDGNANAGDGCSAACFVETAGATESDGWSCPTPGQACVRTKCGNGMQEGSEPCDDGNNNLGDGCTPFCRREPVCPAAGGACNTACGDGLLLPADAMAGQTCDDGNTRSGDGCSADCKLEMGYKCATMPVAQDPLRLPIVYRDFKPYNQAGHPDFEAYVGMGDSGIVEPMLGPMGKPVHVMANKLHTSQTPGGMDLFSFWYRDDPKYNMTIVEALTFDRLMNGSYQYSSFAFFPLDGRGFGNYTVSPAVGGQFRNFHFTSEIRHWFEYRGGETLSFRGDDDLWVFINKRLTVDLGGVHSALSGTVTLDMTNGSAQVCDLLNPCAGGGRRTVQLGLQVGNVYEIAVFHAERRTDASNYQLTLSNFSGTRTSCASVCGDGIATPDEACDLGTMNEASPYGRGKCSTMCTVGPYCGDGKVEPARGEECDGGGNCDAACKRRMID